MRLVEWVNLEQDKLLLGELSEDSVMYFLLPICLFSNSSGSDGVWSLFPRQVFGFVLEACRGLELPGGEGPFQILF